MVKEAIKYNPKFEISDIEFKLEGKSYSYLTVLELYKKYNIDGNIKFIIGTDAFSQIKTWYETDKLKKIVDFIVFIRDNKTVNFENLKLDGYNFKFTNMPFTDISSTELRQRIVENKPIDNLVTEEVKEYIIKNGLYRN